MKFSRVNRLLWGADPEIPQYRKTVELFVRGTGFIFLVAFFSLWTQVHGLIGEQGVLPAGQLMDGATQYFDQNNLGAERYFRFPTLGWLASGDSALTTFALLGIIASALALSGVFPTITLFISWLMYLTLARMGQDFLGFQWDSLLLETGFIALLISPWLIAANARPMAGAFFRILLVRWLYLAVRER